MALPSVLAAAFLYTVTAMAQSSLATVPVAATARVEERISLSISTEVLQFVVGDETGEATAAIHFTAGVRARPGRDVLLIAEPGGDLEGGAGAPAPLAALHVAGEGEGASRGVLPRNGSCVVARWIGGGKRHGRIVFTLRGAAPGAYSMPVRLSVSVP